MEREETIRDELSQRGITSFGQLVSQAARIAKEKDAEGVEVVIYEGENMMFIVKE